MTNIEAYIWIIDHFAPCNDGTKQNEALRVALEALKSVQLQPVRCKECKHGAPNGIYGCRLERFSCSDDSVRMYAEDFCSRGKRKQKGVDE